MSGRRHHHVCHRCVSLLLLLKTKKRYVFIWPSIQSFGPLKALYTFPPLADLFISTPTRLLLKALSHAAITRNDYSLTFPPRSIARYSFMQLSERKWPNFETVVKGDSNPCSLDCESGVLPPLRLNCGVAAADTILLQPVLS